MILNETYNKKKKIVIDKGVGNYLYYKNKKLIDLSCFNGVLLLGHNHSVFKNSLKSYVNFQLSMSAEQNSNAKNLSKLVKYFFPKIEKLIFCNTGTEAVIKSLRIAKAINKKKDKIVCTTGSWHGSVDQTLFYPDIKLKAKPISNGINAVHKKNLIFVPYNDFDNTKKIIEKNINKINCLLIEPITASLPDIRSIEYLKKLLLFCKNKKITVIFDEIITGFRCLKGSVQSRNNLNPDITLLGKVLGGGSPIGAIGINKKINKILKNKKIFYGGTFSANNFTTHLGVSILNYLKLNKKIIYNLSIKCKTIETKINNYIIQNNIDANIYRYDSLLRIVFSRKNINNRIQRDFFEKKVEKNKKLFIEYLFKKGIYYPPNGVILLPATIKNNDVKKIINVTCKGLKKFFKK